MADNVQVLCPACSRSFTIPPSKLGKSAKCPCGETFKLELPAPPDDDEDDLYGFADDDLPALSNPPSSPPPRAAPAAAPAVRAAKPAASGRIGGYDAAGAIGIGLTGKRHVEPDEPPAIGKGAAFALVLTAIAVGVWYAINASLPPGSPVPVGVMGVVVGLVAGLGMALGAVSGSSGSGFVATLIALAGIATAKFLIITTIILPNVDERNAQNVERTFGAEVKVEDLKTDWRREDVVEQMVIESFRNEEEYEYAGPDTIAGRTNLNRQKSKDLTDEELVALEARRDLRIARNMVREASMQRQLDAEYSTNERVLRIYEDRAEEELAAMTDEQILAQTLEARQAGRREELIELHAAALLKEEGGNPDEFDDKTFDRLAVLSEQAKTELAQMSSEERADLYDKHRSAAYEVDLEAEVASKQRNNEVEKLAAAGQTASDMFSCADLVFFPIGLAVAFGLGVTGKFWGRA